MGLENVTTKKLLLFLGLVLVLNLLLLFLWESFNFEHTSNSSFGLLTEENQIFLNSIDQRYELSTTRLNSLPRLEDFEFINERWATQFDAVKIPSDGYYARYFHRENYDKILQEEHVDTISLQKDSHFNVHSTSKYGGWLFGVNGLWVGELNVPEGDVYDVSVSEVASDGQIVRLFIDGKKVIETESEDSSQKIHLQSGTYQIEVETVGTWRPLSLNVEISPEVHIYSLAEIQQITSTIPNEYELWMASVHGSLNEDMSIDVVLESSKNSTSKPIVLLLDSRSVVLWNIENRTEQEILFIHHHTLLNGNRAQINADIDSRQVLLSTYGIGAYYKSGPLPIHYGKFTNSKYSEAYTYTYLSQHRSGESIILSAGQNKIIESD